MIQSKYKNHVKICRMADRLWELYCRRGLRAHMLEYYGTSDERLREALHGKHEALALYIRYCKLHKLPISDIDWKQV